MVKVGTLVLFLTLEEMLSIFHHCKKLVNFILEINKVQVKVMKDNPLDFVNQGDFSRSDSSVQFSHSVVSDFS